MLQAFSGIIFPGNTLYFPKSVTYISVPVYLNSLIVFIFTYLVNRVNETIAKIVLIT
ncbi:hypothetical protein BH10BAC2_BH10BAC2_17600 [soil metagenome]